MKLKNRFKKVLIAAFVAMFAGGTVSVLSIGTSLQEAEAASNPYPTTQDYDKDGYYEVPCTRFAWQQAYDNLGIALPAWGNAGRL